MASSALSPRSNGDIRAGAQIILGSSLNTSALAWSAVAAIALPQSAGAQLPASGEGGVPRSGPIQCRWCSSAYFRHFGDGAWLWGTRLSYSYLGTTSSLPNLVIPQFGSTTNPNVSSFSGYSVTGSYSVSVYHQTSFMPFVGRSFDNSFVYAGAGPSLS
jgi:hypothetical protein